MMARPLPDSGRLAGIVTAAELVESGLTKAEIRVMARNCVLTSVRFGVYAKADLAAGVDERVLAIAAAEALVANSVASHQDAAILHGLNLLKRPARDRVSLSRS